MKKLLVTALTTVLVVSMVACGGKKNDVTSETTETPAVSTESATTETTEAEATETTVTENETATGATLGQTLLAVFKDQLAANPEMTAQELADAVITNEAILFMGGSMPVEPGFLSGFSAEEMTGFEEAVCFMPMMGTIPFVGYVFTLAEDADVDAFISTLETNADPRWNICTEAEETVIEAVGNKVFFLMCPKSLEG